MKLTSGIFFLEKENAEIVMCSKLEIGIILKVNLEEIGLLQI
jgi:hypothetical protein